MGLDFLLSFLLATKYAKEASDARHKEQLNELLRKSDQQNQADCLAFYNQYNEFLIWWDNELKARGFEFNLLFISDANLKSINKNYLRLDILIDLCKLPKDRNIFLVAN